MSITVNKKDFFDVLQKSFPIIPMKSSLQILSNFKLSFIDNSLEVSTTDLDHFLKVYTSAKGSDFFDITVNARKLFEIVRELPEGIVSLDLSENVLILKSEKGFSCKIAGSDVHDFPGFPEDNISSSFSVSSLILKDLVLKGCFAAAKDESRAVLCGVLFKVMDNKIGMVSTDGHRLGCCFYNNYLQVSSTFESIIPPKSLLSLTRLFDNKIEENINVEIGEKYIRFYSNFFSMYSKLMDGPYPDYTKVIPKNNPKIAIIEKNTLQIAVKRVSVLSNQKTHLIKFTFSNNSLEIIVSNRDIGGEARDVINVSYDNDNHSIGFNSHYLLEILDIIKSEKIRLEMNTQISACLIYPYFEDSKNQECEDTFLIMPLRIIDDV
jgi:DNA polymerase III subunit beta